MRDETAASPLVVILSFVAVAVVVTAAGYALLFDRPEARLQVLESTDADGLGFDVTQAAGNLQWDEVTLRLLDRAGTDQAGTFLHAPTGSVGVGDRITVQPTLPAGHYLLLVLHDGDELARLALEV